MSYGADFANADPANAPLDPPIFIGADAFFWGAILLALAAALLLGWFFGSQSGNKGKDAAPAIWEAINDAARAAMGSNDDALRGRAQTLLKVIEARLGKTLVLAKGVSGNIGKLKDAVDGKGPGEAHGHGPGHGPGHGGHGPGGHGEPAAPSGGGGGGGGGGAATANITIVTSAPADHTHSSGGGHGPAKDAKPEKRDLNHREQTDALRLAVAHFAEHWRDETARVRELRQARAELSDPGPPRPPRPAGSNRPPAGRISGTRAKH